MKGFLRKVCILSAIAIFCSTQAYAKDKHEEEIPQELKDFMDESTVLLDSYTINEFEVLQSNPQTRSFSNTVKFDENVLKYKQYSDAELLKVGFTEEQIQGIKNYDFTNQTRALVASNLNVRVSTSGHTYVPDQDKTYMGLHTTFTWSSPPLIEEQHTIIAGVTGLSHRYTRTPHSQSVMLTYRQPNGSDKVKEYSDAEIGYHGLGVNYFEFPGQHFLYIDDVTNKIYYEDITVARLNSYFVTSGKEKMSEVVASYTTSGLGIKPSFSISGLKINISFSPIQEGKVRFQKHYPVALAKDYGSVLTPVD